MPKCRSIRIQIVKLWEVYFIDSIFKYGYISNRFFVKIVGNYDENQDFESG